MPSATAAGDSGVALTTSSIHRSAAALISDSTFIMINTRPPWLVEIRRMEHAQIISKNSGTEQISKYIFLKPEASSQAAGVFF